ncbi:MAG: DNA-directed RNA polymerase subunit alpha [Armatimonadota bacterium]
MLAVMEETQVRTVRADEQYGKFIVEPLERGYGTTLGNALRRVLLSSIPGAAVTSVRIEGVLSEFEPIPGVKEDTIHFLLNLKNLAIRINSAQPRDQYLLRLNRQGPGVVYAVDIECPADVEIVNPDLYLATLSDASARLNVEMIVERGRGYVPAVKPERTRGAIGQIRTNALFSPIVKVNFLVEPTLVGDRTDFDRLILEVWTNGAVHPQEAVAQAAEILRDHFARIMMLGNEEELDDRSPVLPEPVSADIPDRPLEELGFSTRVLNALRGARITTLYRLLSKTESELRTIRNFGDNALKEVRDKLASMGLHLKRSSRR